MNTINRHYYKCPVCLSVMVIEREKHTRTYCSICDVELLWMGRVSGDLYIREEKKCACDERCTGAQGPNCDCKCGGKNHGTGAVVTVITEMGKIKAGPIDREKAVQRRDEYRNYEAQCRDILERLPRHQEYQNGTFIPGDDYWRLRQGYSAMGKLLSMKSSAGRVKAFERFLKEYKK